MARRRWGYVVATMLLAGGVAWSQASSNDFPICIKSGVGQLYQPSSGKCLSGDTLVVINKLGPAGPKGDPGDAGPQGPPGPPGGEPPDPGYAGSFALYQGTTFLARLASVHDCFRFKETIASPPRTNPFWQELRGTERRAETCKLQLESTTTGAMMLILRNWIDSAPPAVTYRVVHFQEDGTADSQVVLINGFIQALEIPRLVPGSQGEVLLGVEILPEQAERQPTTGTLPARSEELLEGTDFTIRIPDLTTTNLAALGPLRIERRITSSIEGLHYGIFNPVGLSLLFPEADSAGAETWERNEGKTEDRRDGRLTIAHPAGLLDLGLLQMGVLRFDPLAKGTPLTRELKTYVETIEVR